MFKRVFYTDGACSQNGTWEGGYGVIELNKNNDKYNISFKKSEHCSKTTNNREELKAMIEALKQIDKYINSAESDTEYIIYTDSAYVCNTCNQWIWSWSKNGWKNSKKVIVENVDLIQNLYEYLTKNFSKCQILKIKGHNGELGNELADALSAENNKKWKDLIKKYSIEE